MASFARWSLTGLGESSRAYKTRYASAALSSTTSSSIGFITSLVKRDPIDACLVSRSFRFGAGPIVIFFRPGANIRRILPTHRLINPRGKPLSAEELKRYADSTLSLAKASQQFVDIW